jgi:hypothetical protein
LTNAFTITTNAAPAVVTGNTGFVAVN